MVDTTGLSPVAIWHESSSLSFLTMKNIEHSPHFYKDSRYDGTFEELMNQAVGGISKRKDAPKMHLWLSPTATQAQVELVKKMIGDDTGRDNTSTE